MSDMSTDRTLGGKSGREKWALAEGATLGGYRIVKPLGRGGMGEVYLAENVQTDIEFALKLLPSDLGSDSGFRERFRREAAVLQTLRHDGIVMVHHAAEEGGRFFLTMDYVDGGSLDDRLKAEGKLAEDETARIALELCDALRYAHGKGVIHRDLKPSNVLLDKDGRAKLSDFGLARVVGDDFLKCMTERSISLSMARTDAGKGLSQSDNAVVGTYEYMSPEQKVGQPADERSDVFSLGLVVFRMLTGKRAPGLKKPSELVPGLDAVWDAILTHALEEDPERRSTSVSELAGALMTTKGRLEATHGAGREGCQMKCLGCQGELKPGWKVCPLCGAKVSEGRLCGSCGTRLELSWKVCPSCGSPAASASSHTEPARGDESGTEAQLRRECESDLEAYEALLNLELNGLDVVETRAGAGLAIWQKAASRQIDEGLTLLGLCYYGGYGVQKNLTKAEKTLHPAASREFAPAQYALSLVYQTKGDDDGSNAWAGRAARNGYGPGMFAVHLTSEGDEEKHRWLLKAAQSGFAYAQNALGFNYQCGVYVEKDLGEAKKWYFKAANQGLEEAKEAWQELQD